MEKINFTQFSKFWRYRNNTALWQKASKFILFENIVKQIL